MMRFWPLISILVAILSGCTTPPTEQSPTSAPVVKPKPMPKLAKPSKPVDSVKPQSTARSAVPETPMTQALPEALPQGWHLTDPQGIVQRASFAKELGAMLIWVSRDAGLDVFSAQDSQHQQNYYKGKVDGAHAFLLPSGDESKLLITFNNRKNARFSVLLSR
jgi:hypothetical protein